MPPRLRAAVAGAIAATIWGLQEPLDRRIFRCRYSDIAIVGWSWHAANGAVFGLAFDAVRRRVEMDQRRLALALALTEHVALWPAMLLVDRELARSPSAFAQGSYRHALFGFILGRLA